MKKLKRLLALAIAMAMVVALALPAMAAQQQPDGSITVNSPIMGSKYTAYRVFDMTTNATNDSFSYTIDTESPFYAAVRAYADVPANKLKLTAIQSEHRDAVAGDPSTPAYDKFNVSTEDGFDAQKFGQALQIAIDGKPAEGTTPAVAPTINATDLADYKYSPNYENGQEVVTVATSEKITFGKEGNVGSALPLGYYLITSVYPSEKRKVTVNATASATDTTKKWEFDKDSTDAQIATAAQAYAENEVTDAVVNKYIADNDLKKKKYGEDKVSEWNSTDTAEIKNQLIASTKADFITKVDRQLNEIKGSASDINAKEPILVFVDSTTPNATINEKNEIPKWDVPVNPGGHADVEGVPDHGEPKGGKNIIVREADDSTDPKTPAIYADWSEANVGDSVHYQLRINAMNFVREGGTAGDVRQVKEYFLSDYRNPNMHFDEGKGLHISVVNSDGTNVTVGTETGKDYLDYTSKAGDFFANGTGNEETPNTTPYDGNGVLKTDGSNNGIMVPWVTVSEPNAELDASHPVYTTSIVPKDPESFLKWNGHTQNHEGEQPDNDGNIPKHDDEGYLLDKDNQKIKDGDTYYVYSLYNSDVTIVVDYYMILDDTAVVDEPGNPNYAQYAYTPVETDSNGKPTVVPQEPNDEEDKPSQLKEVDEATVYTFALAFVKVDNKGNSLANATFELPFYVNKTLQNGTYVYAMSNEEYAAKVAAIDTDETTSATEKNAAKEALKAAYINSVTTTADGVITIKGVKQDEYSFTETEAPVGFNKLEGPFTVEAKKSGGGVTTKTESTIYLDAQGNVTDVYTETTVTPAPTTDQDSNVPNVPVYQFNPVVNQQGTELPSTGGIGTTIFYVVGAILVIGAGVVLITKRRMDA